MSLTQQIEETLENIQAAKLSQLAVVVYDDWKRISPYAEPYLAAMTTLESIDENYMSDSGESIVLYFLANAASWRGEVARQVKAEMKRRLGR